MSTQLTILEARRSFNEFLPEFIDLPLSWSPADARRLTTGAELQAQLFFRGQSGPAITRLANEAFYVPRLSGYPRWFLATGQQGGASSAGHLFVMVQSAPSMPWKTAMALYDFDSAAGMLHQLATTVQTDSHGYAVAVPLDDPTLVVAPSAMSGAYAGYLDGHGGAAAALFQHGPNTSGYRQIDRAISRGSVRYGWRDTDHQASSGLPVYALRLDTGGAIVIFSTRDTAGWRAETAAASLPTRPSRSEAMYVPPAFLLQRLGVTSVTAGMLLTATAIDRVLAFVQPKGVGYIYPLVVNGAATSVSVSRP